MSVARSRGGVATTLGRALEPVAFTLFFASLLLAPVSNLDPRGLLWLEAGVMGTLTLTLLVASLRGWLRLPALRLLLPLALFLGGAALSALLSPYPFASERGMLGALTLASGFLLASLHAVGPRRRRLLLTALLLTALLTVGYALLQTLEIAGVPPAPEGRSSGFYPNPNHFAGLLDLSLPLTLALALFGRRRRPLFALLALPQLVAVGLTYSRGGWAAVLAGSLLLMAAWFIDGVRQGRSWQRGLGLLLVVGLMGAAGIGFLTTSPRLDGGLAERISAFTDLRGNSSVMSRLTVGRAALRLVADHPLLGVGPGNFAYSIRAYRPAQITSDADMTLHNAVTHALDDYLQVASENGLPSLAGFLAFWLIALFTLPRRRGERALRIGGVAAIVALMVHGLADGNLYFVTSNGYLAFALVGLLHAPTDPGELEAEIATSP